MALLGSRCLWVWIPCVNSPLTPLHSLPHSAQVSTSALALLDGVSFFCLSFFCLFCLFAEALLALVLF